MRCPPLHVGDLVYIKGTDIHGVVTHERRTGVYDIHVFQDNRTFTFPRGMIGKLKPIKETI